MTIPGISIIRANIIAAIVCQPARFENKHKFWGYCMLVRHIQSQAEKSMGTRDFLVGANSAMSFLELQKM
ncbi:MAG: transposase [Bdellovibrionales bacterium]|nr:transposase [Bdellovibrionales bacterium]